MILSPTVVKKTCRSNHILNILNYTKGSFCWIALGALKKKCLHAISLYPHVFIYYMYLLIYLPVTKKGTKQYVRHICLLLFFLIKAKI